MPEVSLLLPNRNNDRVLDLFFERLDAHTTHRDFELIVVDDGSTDRSREVLRRWQRSERFPDLTVIEKPPSGIVDALNLALARASGEIVVRLDGDATIETPGWLERMLGFYRSSESVGVVTGRTDFDDGLLHSCGINVVGPEGERPRASESPERLEAAEVDSAGGCCMMFSRELAERIGGFDTRYSPVWVEDFDFALGARREGRKVFCLPEIEIVHHVGLRNPRDESSAKERALYRLRHRFGRVVPRSIRSAVAGAARLGHADPAKRELLSRHYAAWRDKWGFDPLNPDMDEVLRRYGGTEVCWAHDPERRRAGEEILAAHRRRESPKPVGDRL